MSSLTIMERNAVIAARPSLFDALVAIGRAEAFNDCTAEQMDSVIERVWNGLRSSMTTQSIGAKAMTSQIETRRAEGADDLNDQIPF